MNLKGNDDDLPSGELRKWAKEVLIPLLIVLGMGGAGGTMLHTPVSDHQEVVTSELIDLWEEVYDLRGQVMFMRGHHEGGRD